MKDNFDTHKWKKAYALRDFQIQESINPIELQRKIEDIILAAYNNQLDLRDIKVILPTKSDTRGRAKILKLWDVPYGKTDFIRNEFKKIGLKVDERATWWNYDVEPGEKIIQPVIVFTYL